MSTLYANCETGSKALSPSFMSSLLGYPELPGEFLTPVKVSLPPERPIKANTLTVISLTKSTNFIFHLSSYIFYNCCFYQLMCCQQWLLPGTKALQRYEANVSVFTGTGHRCWAMVDRSSAWIWLLVREENKNNQGEEHELPRMRSLYAHGCLLAVGFVCFWFSWRA